MIEKAIEYAPSLAIMLILVVIFLRHIREQTRDFKATLHEYRVEFGKSLDKNTDALHGVQTLLARMNGTRTNG